MLVALENFFCINKRMVIHANDDRSGPTDQKMKRILSGYVRVKIIFASLIQPGKTRPFLFLWTIIPTIIEILYPHPVTATSKLLQFISGPPPGIVGRRIPISM